MFSARLLPGILILLTAFARRGEAQRLDALRDEERCRGEQVVDITFRGARRDLVGRGLGGAGAFLNRTLLALQPATRVNVVRRYLLLKPGDTCVEQRRAESERVLRAQPFISDAVIRVQPVGPGAVQLNVETIDEFVLYAEAWGGTREIPGGLELGTANLMGAARAVRGLVEVGRGNEIGWGMRYTDFQAFGRTLVLDARAGQRPMTDAWSVSLQRPFLTNFQQTAWQFGIGEERRFFTFRDPVIREISLEYFRRRWQLGGVRRFGGVNRGANFGTVLTGELADRVRTVRFGPTGAVPVASPPELARYGKFEAVRAGLAAGVRRVRFLPVRGLAALSAPEDVPIGAQLFVLGLQGIGAVQQLPADRVGVLSASGAAGSPRSLWRFTWNSEWRTAGDSGIPRQFTGSGRVAWFGKFSEGHLTTLAAEAAISQEARVPRQVDFRDLGGGLLGFRGADVGGAERVVLRFEERHIIPSPIQRVELAVAALAQAGRIRAGDAPYGLNTQWRYGVGGALMAALPRGSKQAVRLEVGFPVNPFGRRTAEFRLWISDLTGVFWREPGAIWLSREAESATRTVSAH